MSIENLTLKISTDYKFYVIFFSDFCRDLFFDRCLCMNLKIDKVQQKSSLQFSSIIRVISNL